MSQDPNCSCCRSRLYAIRLGLFPPTESVQVTDVFESPPKTILLHLFIARGRTAQHISARSSFPSFSPTLLSLGSAPDTQRFRVYPVRLFFVRLPPPESFQLRTWIFFLVFHADFSLHNLFESSRRFNFGFLVAFVIRAPPSAWFLLSLLRPLHCYRHLRNTSPP